jgi:hypothetical protein
MRALEGDLGVPTTEEWSATERVERSADAYRIEDLRGGFERYPLCRHGVKLSLRMYQWMRSDS